MLQNKDIHHFDYIDALRGIAILLVIIVHVSQTIPGLSPLFIYITSRGQFGVQLFFIISALTLLLSYEQRILKDGEQVNIFFFIRRLFRIAPMFYAAIIFYTFILLLNGNDFYQLPFLKILVSFLFLQTFYPPAINFIPQGGWTVATEMLFYLCIPYLFKIIKNLRLAIYFFGITFITSLVLRWALVSTSIFLFNKKIEGGWYLYFWLPNQLPVFAIGFICYHLIKNPQLLSSLKQTRLLIFASIWAILVLSVGYRYTLVPQHILISLSFGCFLLAMSISRLRLFQNKIFIFFGKISFSLYLVHFFIISQLEKILIQDTYPLINFIILYTSVIVIGGFFSYLTYNFIERYGIAWGKIIILKIKDN